jgi:hypothetical protein
VFGFRARRREHERRSARGLYLRVRLAAPDFRVRDWISTIGTGPVGSRSGHDDECPHPRQRKSEFLPAPIMDSDFSARARPSQGKSGDAAISMLLSGAIAPTAQRRRARALGTTQPGLAVQSPTTQMKRAGAFEAP